MPPRLRPVRPVQALPRAVADAGANRRARRSRCPPVRPGLAAERTRRRQAPLPAHPRAAGSAPGSRRPGAASRPLARSPRRRLRQTRSPDPFSPRLSARLEEASEDGRRGGPEGMQLSRPRSMGHEVGQGPASERQRSLQAGQITPASDEPARSLRVGQKLFRPDRARHSSPRNHGNGRSAHRLYLMNGVSFPMRS